MARKKSKDEINTDDIELDENGEPIGQEKGGKLMGFLVAIIIIAIWLAIFAILIKMDVGGIGSMLRPYLKNVPVISMILPDATDEQIAEEEGSQYKTLPEALARIKELEKEVDDYKNSGVASSRTVADMQAEIDRLKQFEDKQAYYDQLKDEFDREVVYADNAPDVSEYKKWYESIDADNAAQLYKEVVQKLQYSQQVKDWAETYSKMEPANAAQILEEMTGDTDLVSKILKNMASSKRAAIMAEMTPLFAAKITKVMYP